MDDPRSHTQSLINLVVLSPLDIRRHLNEIVDRDLPTETLPTFLHEVTHHWCFNTPVGIALHLLFMRARRSAAAPLLQEQDRRIDSPRLLHDVVRYEAALRFLRPLSEGLALFAEHDAIPGDSRILSRPLQLVAGLYGRGVGVSGDTPLARLPLVLAAGRLSPRHIRRKADLLIQPLSCDGGGYLPGYLLTKELWMAACRASEMFYDTDFFLQYIRHQLFDDWTLVSVLLDDSITYVDLLDRVWRQISKRLKTFLEIAVQGDRPKAFETAREKGDRLVLLVRTKIVETAIEYIPLEEDPDAQAGRTRLEDLLHTLFDNSLDEPSQVFALQDTRELSLRSIVNLGHASLHGQPGPGGFELYSDGNRLATVSSTAISVPDLAAGAVEIDLIATSEPGGLCAILMRDERVLALLPIGNVQIPASLADLIVDRQTRVSFQGASQALIQVALATAGVEDRLKHVRERITHGLNTLFIPMALSHVSDKRLAQVMDVMADDGVLPILGGDLGLVMDAAAASLAVPSPYPLDILDSFHCWSAGSPSASIERINHLVREGLGYQPFREYEGEFLPFALI